MSQRTLRVCALLKRELGALIQRDYVFDGFLVSVNAVDVTPDLRQGHVFVGVVGDAAKRHRVIARLNAEHGAIQHKISRRVTLKHTPKLRFALDDSVERGVRILTAIQGVDALPIAPPEAVVDHDDDEESRHD